MEQDDKFKFGELRKSKVIKERNKMSTKKTIST